MSSQSCPFTFINSTILNQSQVFYILVTRPINDVPQCNTPRKIKSEHQKRTVVIPEAPGALPQKQGSATLKASGALPQKQGSATHNGSGSATPKMRDRYPLIPESPGALHQNPGSATCAEISAISRFSLDPLRTKPQIYHVLGTKTHYIHIIEDRNPYLKF
jgi:hypothetical protein